MPAKPKAGDKAPDFTATITGGDHSAATTITLSELRDKPVVLYFYPKDDTPGCTTQACGIRDEWSRLKGKCHLFGISTDPLRKHDKFITKYSLPFPLISDEDHGIVNAYGVWVEKSLYGRKYLGTERSTFIIDTDGKIKAVLEKVKPAEHVKLVLEALAADC